MRRRRFQTHRARHVQRRARRAINRALTSPVRALVLKNPSGVLTTKDVRPGSVPLKAMEGLWRGSSIRRVLSAQQERQPLEEHF